MRSSVSISKDAIIPNTSYTVTQHSTTTIPKINRSNFNVSQFEKIVAERQNTYRSTGQTIDAKYEDGGRYRGSVINGIRVGRGDYVFPNGDYYNGFWENDMFSGIGLYRYKNNSKAYFGEFMNNSHHGKGALTIDGPTPVIIYQGGWQQGLKHGIGIQFYSHDPVQYYEGNWVRGTKNGMGAYFYPDGTVYKGEWFNNKKHGRGQLIGKDGIIYSGIWNNDAMDNSVPLNIQYPKSIPTVGVVYDTFEGDHFNGARNGRGVYRFHNGNQGINEYGGQFQNNKRNGMGTYTTSFGDKYIGTFINGQKHGQQGRYEWADGSTYVGMFENDNISNGVYVDSKDGHQRQVNNGRVQVT